MDKRDKPFRDSPRNQAEKQGQGRDTFREAGRSQAQSLRRADSEDRSRNARRGDSEDWSRNARREDTGGQARNARRAERAGGGNRRGPGGPDARQVALMALSDVMHSGAYAQLALSAHLRAARGLSLEDKKLATIIFYGALENRLRIAWVLKQFVEDIPQRAVEDVLHIAAAQLLFLDRVPDHAAVDQAVRQIKALGREQYAALVNGVLRSLIRARDQGDIRYPDPQQDPVRYLSVMHSLPEAITRRLANQYGLEETRAMIAYRPDQRTQTVRPNLLRMDDRAFEEYLDRRGWSWEKGLVPHAYRIRGGGDLAGDPGFREGLYSVQGEGSMLPCYAVAPQQGWQVLDACAAPGGKSSLLCEMMGLTGLGQARAPVRAAAGRQEAAAAGQPAGGRPGRHGGPGGIPGFLRRGAHRRPLLRPGRDDRQAGHQVPGQRGGDRKPGPDPEKDSGRLRAPGQAGGTAGVLHLHRAPGGKPGPD